MIQSAIPIYKACTGGDIRWSIYMSPRTHPEYCRGIQNAIHVYTHIWMYIKATLNEGKVKGKIVRIPTQFSLEWIGPCLLEKYCAADFQRRGAGPRLVEESPRREITAVSCTYLKHSFMRTKRRKRENNIMQYTSIVSSLSTA